MFSGEDTAYRKDGKRFTVVQCQDCGLQYVNPRPTASAMKAYYPPAYYSGDQPRQLKRIDHLSRRVKRCIRQAILEDFYGYPSSCRSSLLLCRKGLLWPVWMLRMIRGRDLLPYIGRGKLLDVGCGLGVNLKTFKDQGWDVSGVEIDSAAADQARARVGDCISVGTIEEAKLEPESFDVIVFNHSLEHMFNPGDALRCALRLLKSHGMVVITVPNAGGLEAKLFGPYWIGFDLPRHLFHFDRRTLPALLKRTGFRTTRIRTGKGSAFFMASLERFWAHYSGRSLPIKKIIERMFVRPFCLLIGHLGYGTEITVYAVKNDGREAPGSPNGNGAIVG
jgi:SAM-dependent methyltransferase